MKMEAADGLALAAAASDEVAPGQPGQQMSAVRISGSAAMPTSAAIRPGASRPTAEVLRFCNGIRDWTNRGLLHAGWFQYRT